MTVKAKICGITSKDAITSAVEGGADYIGFVFFHKSPRNITPKKAAKLAAFLPDTIKTVGVFVDVTDVELDKIFKDYKPDYLQCHGKESHERIAELRKKYKIPVIKAIAVRSSDDVAKGKAFANVADMILFDAKVPSSPLPGGNGLAFDWTLLKSREFNVPWFLSGGLNIENVAEAVKISGAKMVDVSSSLESEPGVKDHDLIKAFLKKVKSIK
jgi:phosphoribosylanthranilate isomerase